MCQLIEEVLTAAAQAGAAPAEIRLGRRQMEQFRKWGVRFAIGGPATEGPTDAYDNIPVIEVDEETHRSVRCVNGRELILD